MVISEFVRETAKQLGDNARFEAELMVMSVKIGRASCRERV